MEKRFYDKELGVVTIRVSARARHMTVKMNNDGCIVVTMPVNVSEREVFDLIEQSRDKLLAFMKEHQEKHPLLSDTTALKTNSFTLHIFRAERKDFHMYMEGKILHIACPQDTDFEHKRVQKLLRELLDKALLHEGGRVLPRRLMVLASQHHFFYAKVRVSNSKSRWGSCNFRRNISLSSSLMLLPDHLIDYVLLHELCHTIEMNHSERFWELMNRVTENKAFALRKELRGYRML
ncbi:MAG: M48 family metallopeptidase [Tannerellaceae bacterium]|jgi:predicted metal-dependent hydrolase|nr:M48 family metallopeptidase [Tannerellaceae bacterium]